MAGPPTLAYKEKESEMAVLDDSKVGVTAIGTGVDQGILHVKTQAVKEKPSIIALDAVNASSGARTTHYLWVDSTGDLRIHNAIPTDEDSDGTVVGSMS